MANIKDLMINGKKIQEDIKFDLKNIPNDKRSYTSFSTRTLETYLASINKIHREIKTDIPITDLKWLEDTNDIEEFLSSLKTPSTKKTYISIILTLLYNNTQKYNKLIEYYIELTKDNKKDILLAQKHENPCITDKIITLNDYDKFLKTLSKNDGLYREYIQFLFLRYYPIRNELATLIYITSNDYTALTKEDKSNNNYIIEQSKKFQVVRNKYKTFKTYGTATFDIPTGILKTALKKYIQSNNIKSGDALFIYNGVPQSQNQLSQRLAYVSYNSELKIKLSTASVFKIILCDYFNNTNDTLEQQRKLLEYYSNIRKTKYDDLLQYYVYKKDTESVISDD